MKVWILAFFLLQSAFAQVAHQGIAVKSAAGGGGGAETITPTFIRSAQSFSSTTHTLSGAGLTSGDHAILFVMTVESSSVSSVDQGFSKVGSAYNFSTGGEAPEIEIWEKTATGSEGTITVTLGSSTGARLTLLNIAGTDLISPSITNSGASSSGYTMTGVTVPTDGIAIQLTARIDSPWASFGSMPAEVTSLNPVDGSHDNSNGGIYGHYISYIYADGATGNLAYTSSGFGRWAGAHLTFEAGSL